MIILSPHVSEAECRCRCCGKLPASGMDHDVLDLFELIRDAAGGQPIHINSAYRCPVHNATLTKYGAAKDSQHMKGKALDLTPRHITVQRLYEIADRLNPEGGVGFYQTFVHIDCRGSRARWKGKGVK